MSARAMIEKGSVWSVLHSVGSWLLCCTVLLPVTALILWKSGTFSAAFGYVSSAISFLAAAAAGRDLRRFGKGNRVELLVSAATLIVLLLTVGYLIVGSALDPSAVLSLCSFTLTGCLTGYFMSRKGHAARESKRYRFTSANKK